MVNSWRELEVYQNVCALQQAVIQESRTWPKEETYSLIDQIRRSSRSVGANIAEAWAKRRYPAHFLSKLSDSDGELQETIHWLLSATDCGYLPSDRAEALIESAEHIGKQLGVMMNRHKSFCF
ncbi:four helix bundle protein [Haloferula chungangensis]|uniref:Four helix bundle protein n=1 Tax=Haloferula chungangensis TaxID=1048331 RepID=A0ABW2L9Q1_9BACT